MIKTGLFINSLFIVLFISFPLAELQAQGFEGRLSLSPRSSTQELRFKEAEKILKKKNALFNLDADIQLGLGFANTNNELNKTDPTTQNLQTTDSKIGPAIGAIVDFDFLGFGFTTGFLYSSKGFKYNSNAVGGESGAEITTSMNFINIPLLFFVGFDVNQKVLVDLNFGPYFGILLSQDETTYFKIKNFDFGLSGDLSGAYMFNRFTGVLLGVKYEYGGLNNLQSNEYIKKTTTSTFSIYSGIKFVL